MKLLVESLYAEFVLEFLLLTESSKQSLLNLGFPEVIASLIWDEFGSNAYTVAKWYKDSHGYFFRDGEFPKDWWKRINTSFGKIDLKDILNLYEAAAVSEEQYNEVRKSLELRTGEPFDQEEVLASLRDELKRQFLGKDSMFFSYDDLIVDIRKKTLVDLKPYKNLSFEDAKDKYDKKKVFKDATPIKTYENGWKWINAGKKCQLVGKLMKNCGSTGVMSSDPDRTMLVLFDKGNKPHVVVTWSPNEKRISGDEGGAGSAVKEPYHDYILDLVDTLGAELETGNARSEALKLRYTLKGQVKSIEKVPTQSQFASEYFRVTTNEGTVYYTDSYRFVPEEAIAEKQRSEANLDLHRVLGSVFNTYSGTKSINLYRFVRGDR